MFVSAVTKKGNTAFSMLSQQEADEWAIYLDDNGCTGCTGCTDCTDCTDCTSCAGCTNCTYCVNCIYCIRCTGCTGCISCTSCTGYVIQAGLPDAWRCYGHKIDGVLQITCGCRNKSLSEARSYWANKEDRREVLAAIEYIATIATLRGWKVD